MSGPTLVSSVCLLFSSTGLLPSVVDLSRSIRLTYLNHVMMIRNPSCKQLVWPLPRSLAATSGIDVSFFSYGYLDVSVPRVPLIKLCIHLMIHAHYHMWVPPFGNLRVNGYVLLTAAYRSLSRPSSAPSAKASSRCSLYLTIHCLMRVTSGLHSLLFTRCEFVSGFSQQIVIW